VTKGEPLIESIKKFQYHLFRARGFLENDMKKAKDELEMASAELQKQRHLGVTIESLGKIEDYINLITDAISENDQTSAVAVFTDLFYYIVDMMLLLGE